MNKVATYATGVDSKGEMETFRIGQPVDQTTADKRWYRLDDRKRGMNGQPARPITVRANRRNYTVKHFENRSVTRHGRGLGDERHDKALLVPYRAVKSAKR